jgi:hypothetical protein
MLRMLAKNPIVVRFFWPECWQFDGFMNNLS